MRLLSEIRERIRALVFRRREDREMDEELLFHLERETQKYVDAGVDPTEAERRARLRLGNLAGLREGVRDARGARLVESLFQDAVYALRAFRRAPGFATTAALTIALGIGANTAVFTLVNGALFKSLPFADPERVAHIPSRNGVSYADFLELREQARRIDLGAYQVQVADLSAADAPAARLSAAAISAETFGILGQTPVIGRDFASSDFEASAAPVALISARLWQTRYGRDPELVGRTIRINLVDHTVIGVLPEEEGFPFDTQLWLPLRPDDPSDRRQRGLLLFGRLSPESSFPQADAELDTIAAAINEVHASDPDVPELSLNVTDFRDRNIGSQMRIIIRLLLGAVGFLLLIACANVANLLLSRASHRMSEIAARAALGASRWRLIRQLFVESLVMSLVGGALGLVFARFVVLWFANVAASTGPPYWLNLSMDYRVYGYFLLVCVSTALLFGLAPALTISAGNLVAPLKNQSSGPTRRSNRWRSVLVAGEVALSIVLLTGAGLMMQSLVRSQRIDWGIETDGVLTADLNLPAARYEESARAEFVASLVDRLVASPGLGRVTVASDVPGRGAPAGALFLEGEGGAASGIDAAPVTRVSVADGYFEALGVGLLSGRNFSPADRADSPPVAIVDDAFAGRYWPDSDPIGQRFRWGAEDAPWLTIVGVSPRVYYGGPQRSSDPGALANFYVPYTQAPESRISVISNIVGAEASRTATLQTELAGIDPDLPLVNIQTLDDVLWQRTWPYRIFGAMFAAFALVALAMSGVGLYGVTAFSVNSRTREIGIRIALGADPGRVLSMVLLQGLGQVGLGLALGVPAALGLSQLMTGILFEVSPADPTALIGTSLVMSLVAAIACWIPAQFAVRIDPSRSLRPE